MRADDIPSEADRLGRAFARQDNARHLGLFVDDTFIRQVPRDDRSGERTRQQAADRLNIRVERITILTTCNDHPDTAAVDCDRHED